MNCPNCGNKLTVLKTCNDPEGIRFDRRCGVCLRVYACHKWGLKLIQQPLPNVIEGLFKETTEKLG